MPEASRFRVPETTAIFTVTIPYDSAESYSFNEKLVASLLQEYQQVEWYPSFTSYPYMGKTLPVAKWPILLICPTPQEGLEIRARLLEQCRSPLEVSEPRSGFRERFPQRVQAVGKHARPTMCLVGYGHVVLDIEPDPNLDDVVFESRVDEGTIPAEYLPTIISALREAVFRGGPRGYPLSGFRATLIGGPFHEVDARHSAYRSATLLALWNAFRSNDTQLVALKS